MDLAQTAYDDDFEENFHFFKSSDLGIELVLSVIWCRQRTVGSQPERHHGRVEELEAEVAQYQAIDNDGLILAKLQLLLDQVSCLKVATDSISEIVEATEYISERAEHETGNRQHQYQIKCDHNYKNYPNVEMERCQGEQDLGQEEPRAGHPEQELQVDHCQLDFGQRVPNRETKGQVNNQRVANRANEVYYLLKSIVLLAVQGRGPRTVAQVAQMQARLNCEQKQEDYHFDSHTKVNEGGRVGDAFHVEDGRVVAQLEQHDYNVDGQAEAVENLEIMNRLAISQYFG